MIERTAVMTDGERIGALLRNERPDRVPWFPIGGEAFAVIQEGFDIADTWQKPDQCLSAHRKVSQELGWVFCPRTAFAAMFAMSYGGQIKYHTGEFAFVPTVLRRPVETVEEALNLKLPDVGSSGFIPFQAEYYKKSSQDLLDCQYFGATLFCSVFTHAAEICGPENFLRWMIKKPEPVHHLLRIAVDFSVEHAKYWKELFGTENIFPWVSEPTTASQLISPRQFEQFVSPYVKELNEKLLNLGYKHLCCHICGEQNLNLPHWAKVPMGDPGIVSFGHEVDLKKAAEYFPSDIIMGNIEPANIQFKTPEEVYDVTCKVVEYGKSIPGGFILSSGCTFPPRAPRENVEAIIRAVNDKGWYE